MAHPQHPAIPNLVDTPTAYPLPGVVRILCRELVAAIDRSDYRQAEIVRFSLNAIAESTPPSPPAPGPVRPGYITGAWLMPDNELRERIRCYHATVDPMASFDEAEAHAALCGLAVVR
ncbi:hypothetical protein GO011_11800 [Mycobacterium sp. 20091114027_K0903767]|nr:hypothetical protein [Mycobacterium sp. 20091114027_K0903767]